MTAYTDVMLDLETVGTAPGSGIIAIGAVAFAEGMPETDWLQFQIPPISRAACRRAGLTEDSATLAWWESQSLAAKAVFDLATNDESKCYGLYSALITFKENFFPHDAYLWGNGSDFDNVLLQCAYKSVGMAPPWAYYNNRCFRTMKKQHAGTKEPAFQGTKHNALADAMHQTRWLQAIWNDMRDAERAHDEWKVAVKIAAQEIVPIADDSTEVAQ